MKIDTLMRWGKLGLYLFIICILVLAPTSFFESGHSLCVIKYIFGIECPGCGMSRAISCIFHGNFHGALQYNKLIVLVFPLLCYVFITSVRKEFKQIIKGV
jgi:hypothetical protein